MLAVLSAAMLSACAASQVTDRPVRTADPVIQTRTVTERVCPAELRAPRPARPVPAADAELQGNASGMAWLNALLAYMGLVEDRLSDAAKDCPNNGN
jgi:hypothetical protein